MTATLAAEDIATPAWKRLFTPDYVGARVTSVRIRSWSGVSAYIKELHCDGPFRSDFKSDVSRLLVMLDTVGAPVEARTHASRPAQMKADSLHQMTFAPAAAPIWAHSDGTLFMRHITFNFDARTVASLLDENLSLDGLFRPRFMFFDARLLHLARLFEIECEALDPTDQLYGDGLALALLIRLATIDRASPEASAQGGLTPQQLRRVTEYMTAHLAEPVGLQELAALAQLSRSYFCRAFRRSTGLPPHQWLQRERVNRAKEQLLAASPPISEIALATGFADQAHFTRVFGRHVGVSPALWRRRASYSTTSV